LRLSNQLLHITSGQHLWAEHYDVPFEEIFAVQDDIAAKVANALAARIDQITLVASRHRQRTNLSTYECWLRGMECLHRGTMESDAEARSFFEQALAIDPYCAKAEAGLSLSHFNEWSCQAWDCWEKKENAAYECALRAEALDPDDPVVQVILAKIEQYRRRHGLAETRYRRALHLSPNNAMILIQMASGFALLGEAELAAELGDRALALNPLCPPWWRYYASVPYFVMQDYQRATELGLQTPIIVTDGPAYLAASFAYAGDVARAKSHLNDFQEVFVARITNGRPAQPGEAMRWLLHVNPYRRDEDLQHFAEGVRLAGMDSGPYEPATPVSWPVGNTFRKEGALWMVCYEHEVAHVPEVRGFQDISQLLARPSEEVHCVALYGQPTGSGRGVEVLDEQAKRAYRTRLREIEAELSEAESANDVGRAARAEEEREHLLAEMRKATGLGGRDRRMGDDTERARSAVTWRIRHAIKKLEAAHPALFKHLRHSIKTGVFCSYSPEKETHWFV
jgi:tetratricopeptide (TPR) repeat protein